MDAIEVVVGRKMQGDMVKEKLDTHDFSLTGHKSKKFIHSGCVFLYAIRLP